MNIFLIINNLFGFFLNFKKIEDNYVFQKNAKNKKIMEIRGSNADFQQNLNSLLLVRGRDRSNLGGPFLGQKCVELTDKSRRNNLNARNWDTALLWNFRYPYHKYAFNFQKKTSFKICLRDCIFIAFHDSLILNRSILISLN